MGRLSLQTIVEAVKDLPSLPQVTKRVIALTEDPNATAQDIGAVLNQDQSMTTKVLRLANSAYYGFSREISSINEATVVLGLKAIRSMVMTASVNSVLNKEFGGYALRQGELWKHSQACALAARLIAKDLRYPHQEKSYTAALVHDIGKVVLNTALQDTYQEVIEKADQGQLSFEEVEDAVLGFNHATVGARVAEKWNLPPDLVEAIAFHHHPEHATINPRLTDIVHLSDSICLILGIGLGVDGLGYRLSPEALERLQISESAIESFIARLVIILSEQEGGEGGETQGGFL